MKIHSIVPQNLCDKWGFFDLMFLFKKNRRKEKSALWEDSVLMCLYLDMEAWGCACVASVTFYFLFCFSETESLWTWSLLVHPRFLTLALRHWATAMWGHTRVRNHLNSGPPTSSVRTLLIQPFFPAPNLFVKQKINVIVTIRNFVFKL